MRRFRVHEPFAGFSHLAGAMLAIWGLVALLQIAGNRPWHVVSFAVFGATAIVLYLASAVFHLSPVRTDLRRRLLAVDQAAIFLLIAGTYTPFCLLGVRGPWGWSILGVVWGLALVGITLRFAWQRAPAWIGFSLYLLMGWICLVAVEPMFRNLSQPCLAALVAGGVTYTIGAAVFATQRPRLWPGVFGSHDLWHVFVLGGTGLHYFAVLQLAR